jgi:hypothetical protein
LYDDRGFDQQRSDMPDDHEDNLFAPMDGPGSTTGHWSAQAKRNSVYTEALEMHPGRKMAVAALAALGATVLLVRGASR